MPKTLVACYSRSGTTLAVAERIAQGLDADLDRIEDASMHTGVLGYARGAVEAITRGLPTISSTHDPSEYDLVVLGTPVWTGSIASPMRSYLFLHHGSFRRVAFFATMGGVGALNAVDEMRMLCGNPLDAQHCCFTEREVHSHAHHPVLNTFIAVLAQSIERRAADGNAARLPS